MTLHSNLIHSIAKCLLRILNDGEPADKVIRSTFQGNKNIGKRDRSFIAQHTYDIVRWWRLIKKSYGDDTLDADRDTVYRVIGAWLTLNLHKVPGWKEFRGLRKADLQQNYALAVKERKYKESIPDWLDELGVAELGAKWDVELSALNKPSHPILRANRLKTTRNQLNNFFKRIGITARPVSFAQDALSVTEGTSLLNTSYFQKGFFEMQDAASQMVVPMLEVAPSMTVIDACAGAGGKTLHLSSLMGNQGRIIALDVAENKLERLKVRAHRNGCVNIEPELIENAADIVTKYKEVADRLLIDAPCTGIGTLKRKPHLKWALSPEKVEELHQLQAEILETYWPMLKVGGKMVYATCSIFPSENEKQIEAFLEKHGERFHLKRAENFSPAEMGFDGFYSAVLERIA